MRIQPLIRAMLINLLAFVATLPAVTQVRADSYTVTNTNDSGNGSLRQAMLDANTHPGTDTIAFDLTGCPCVITLNSVLPAITDNLTIQGPGAASLTINGNGQSVFRVLNNALFTLADVTVANGHSVSGGGAIANALSQVVVINSAFISNSAAFGGAINSSGATATLSVSGSVFLGNTAGFGGGLNSSGGLITVTNSSFYSNTAAASTGSIYGGGLASTDGNLVIINNTFTHNQALSPDTRNTYGGGVYLAGGMLQVISSTFEANSVTCQSCITMDGGGLYLTVTQAITIVDSRFTANNAWVGGGIAFNGCTTGSRQPIVVERSSFRNNYGAYGAGLMLYCADAHIEQSLFDGNNAGAGRGGAVYAYDNGVELSTSKLRMERNTIINNIGQWGSGLYIYAVAPFELMNNIIADNHLSWIDRSGAIEIYGDSSGSLTHNTLAHNTGDLWGSYGVMVDSYAGTTILQNNILVSQTVGVSVTQYATVTLAGTLFGAAAWANEQDYGGAGNIILGAANLWGDPDFVSPAAHNYHINAGSAAIDHALVLHVLTDIDNQLRSLGQPDIGADEWYQPVYLPLILN